MQKQEIQNYLIISIKKLYQKDSYFFDKKVHERTIVWQLACYLRDCITEYNIDCEYNRNMDKSKYCWWWNHTPDLIIHKRGENNDNIDTENNILYCECKTRWYETIENKESDISTIKCFMNNDDVYKYNYGLYINFWKEVKDSTFLFFYKNNNWEIKEEKLPID